MMIKPFSILRAGDVSNIPWLILTDAVHKLSALKKELIVSCGSSKGISISTVSSHAVKKIKRTYNVYFFITMRLKFKSVGNGRDNGKQTVLHKFFITHLIVSEVNKKRIPAIVSV